MGGAKSTGRNPDVVIIGGGVIGCAIALQLAQAQLRVTVLERGEFGAEASSAAAGMIAPQGEMVDFDDFFELSAASRDLYPEFVERLRDASRLEALSLELGYRRDGILMVATTDQSATELEIACRLQSEHGLALERLSPEAVHRLVPGISLHTRWGVLVQGDHWIDNEQLTPALVTAGRNLGIEFVGQTAVQGFNARGTKIIDVQAAPATGGETTAYSGGCFILAAGCWSGELMSALGTLPVSPCRGQMLEFEGPVDLPCVVRESDHYIVPRAPGRILAGTTVEYAGYEKAVTGEGMRTILENVARFAPLINKLKFRRSWAGLRPDTPDHRPILGRSEIENLIIATGHFRNGILLAPITAKLISELVITGQTPPRIEAYSPARFHGRENSLTSAGVRSSASRSH